MRKALLPIKFFILLLFLLTDSFAFAQTVVLSFTGMTPHVGQKLEARLIDQSTQKEVDRATIDAITMGDFTLNLKGEIGKSYYIDFYADFNQNGVYDAPPADHAWRIETSDLTMGMNTYSFMHNTNFTDIQWKQLLSFDFTGMNPHVGQKLEIAVRDINRAGKEVGRVRISAIRTASFTIDLPFLEIGHSYMVDFYADFNQNGVYDAPPTDHAWREMLVNVDGDETLSFKHNTYFTDIQWKQLLTFDFTGMNPHVGQALEIRVRDVNQTGREVGRFRLPAILVPDFTVSLPYLELGRTYLIDFYADFNQNGVYDVPPADHAWREIVPAVTGDEQLIFSHNTNFKDIGESNSITVNFTKMNPHVGQLLELRVVDVASGKEVDRRKQIITVPNFEVSLSGIQSGREYQIDFYADFNQNGTYDPPPVDHAWRETFTAGSGNQSIDFQHNTNFTNVDWKYLMTLAATNMTPHLGQKLELRVFDTKKNTRVGSFSMPAILVDFFFIRVAGLDLGANYNVDFYADFNQNGSYDAPPTDHAWRINFDDDKGDELVKFEHNTDFTDIMFNTAVEELEVIERLNIFPNPFTDRIHVSLDEKEAKKYRISLLNNLGQVIAGSRNWELSKGKSILTFNPMRNLNKGLYFVKFEDQNSNVVVLPLLKL